MHAAIGTEVLAHQHYWQPRAELPSRMAPLQPPPAHLSAEELDPQQNKAMTEARK